MKKWILCIPLLVMLFMLFMQTKEPFSQAASTSLVRKNDELNLHDAPRSNTEYSIAMDDMNLKEAPLLENLSSSDTTHMNTNEVAPHVTNGLLPQANYEYTYAPSFEGEAQKTYVASINPFIANAVDLMEEEFIGYTYIESKDSLKLGIAYSDVFFFSLNYPLKELVPTIDKDLSDESNNKTNVMVESTSMTITTKAGTFENVVVLRYPNGSALYLAKGYGVIRITDFEGEITTELIARK
jgi:hypothetical protein